MVKHILDGYPSMEVVPIHYDIGSHGLPGMGLSDQQRSYVRHFDPINAEDTMVFVVVKFVKRSSSGIK